MSDKRLYEFIVCASVCLSFPFVSLDYRYTSFRSYEIDVNFYILKIILIFFSFILSFLSLQISRFILTLKILKCFEFFFSFEEEK